MDGTFWDKKWDFGIQKRTFLKLIGLSIFTYPFIRETIHQFGVVLGRKMIKTEELSIQKKDLVDTCSEKTFMDIKITGKEVVVQSNSLVDAFKRTKLRELKLFLFLISKVNPQKPNDMRFRVTIKELAKAIGVESPDSVYKDIRSIIQNLMEKIITIHKQENGKRTVTDIPLLSYAKYWIDEGYADVEISAYLAPYIIDLHRDFTQYKLSNVMFLSSHYAIRIYEMLKKQEYLGTRIFYIDDLRKMLNIETKLEKFKDFRVKVLDIAQREINNKTDLQVSYAQKKAGRKVVAVEFNIQKKTLAQEVATDCTNLNISPLNIQQLLDFGFSTHDSINMLRNMTNDEAAEALSAANEQILKKTTRNKKALIRTALKEKWRSNIKSEKESEYLENTNQADINTNETEFNSAKPQPTNRIGLNTIGDLLSSFFNLEKTK